MFKTTYVYDYSCTRLHMFKTTSAYDYSCTKLHLYKTTYEKIKTLAFICNTSTSRICPTNRVEPAQLHFLSRLNQCLFRVSSKGSYQCLFTFSAHINVFSHFRLISMSFDIFESHQKTLISMSLTHWYRLFPAAIPAKHPNQKKMGWKFSWALPSSSCARPGPGKFTTRKKGKMERKDVYGSSGWRRVTRGCFGLKAPPLAALYFSFNLRCDFPQSQSGTGPFT